MLEQYAEKNKNKKELMFNVLLDYSDIFSEYIHFKDSYTYKKFMEYSLQNGKYLKSLKYRSGDIIQLKFLYENREKIILNDENIITFIQDKSNNKKKNKLNGYSNAYELVLNLINYQKIKKKKFVFFTKTFWNNCYEYYITKNANDKIQDLLGLYRLLLSYIELGEDDSKEYKEILSEKIDELVQKKLEEITTVNEQLQVLFEYDPYYLYDSDKRNPDIFERINIIDLKKKKDIQYFRNLNLEKVYENTFKTF